MAADLLDRVEVEPRRQFIAIDGAWQQYAAEARGMDLRQERLGDALRALDLVGGGSDGGAEFARASDGVGCGRGHEVHAVACQDVWWRLERVRGWGEIVAPPPCLPRFAGDGFKVGGRGG